MKDSEEILNHLSENEKLSIVAKGLEEKHRKDKIADLNFIRDVLPDIAEDATSLYNSVKSEGFLKDNWFYPQDGTDEPVEYVLESLTDTSEDDHTARAGRLTSSPNKDLYQRLYDKYYPDYESIEKSEKGEMKSMLFNLAFHTVWKLDDVSVSTASQ